MRPEPRAHWDLYALAGATVLAVATVLWSPARVLRALVVLPFLLVGPGYALTAALFPQRSRPRALDPAVNRGPGIDGLERFGLTLGLSLAVLALVGLAANQTPWGIHPVPLVLAVAIISLAGAVVAVKRRRRLPAGEPFQPRWSPPSLPVASARARVLSVAFLAAGVLALGSVGYAVLTDRSQEGFTELYLLDPEGGSSAYPTNASPGEDMSVTVVVANQEDRSAAYTITATAIRGSFAGEGGNSTFEPEHEEALDAWEVDLDPGQRHERNLTFALDEIGHYQVLFTLEMDGADASPYREVYLWVIVRG